MIAWSYSKLNRFNQCPRRYYEIDVAKSIQYTDTEQSLYGSRGHEAIDKQLKTDAPLPKEFKHIETAMEQFKHIRGDRLSEQQFAITQNFTPTTWFGADVWGRAILDAVWIEKEKGKIIDWKFGKQRKDSKQLMISALILFCHKPVIERINTAFVWFVNGKMDVEKYKRDDIPWLWTEIMPDIRRLETAHANNTFPPKPSALCNWCPVKKCNFWRSTDGTGNQKGRR